MLEWEVHCLLIQHSVMVRSGGEGGGRTQSYRNFDMVILPQSCAAKYGARASTREDMRP